MIVSIHQPAYLPWLGLLDRIAKSDIFIVLDNVPFEKGSFINRNKIRQSNPPGWQWLTVPIRSGGILKKPLHKIEIEAVIWGGKHLLSIEQEYGKARHFEEWIERIHQLIYFSSKFERIGQMLAYHMGYLLAMFEIDRPVFFASELKTSGKKTKMLVDLCKKVGATQYLSGPLGRNYLDESLFRDSGIEVQYHDYQHPVYPQRHGGFIPYMSSIDYLFNCGNRLP